MVVNVRIVGVFTLNMDKIEERGLQIVNNHKKFGLITQLGQYSYKVSSVDHFQVVTTDKHEGYSCSCEYYMYKGNPCKHIVAIKYCLENGINIPKDDNYETETLI